MQLGEEKLEPSSVKKNVQNSVNRMLQQNAQQHRAVRKHLLQEKREDILQQDAEQHQGARDNQNRRNLNIARL